MALKKKLAAAAFGLLALGGIGAGVANAATTTPAPPPATSAPAVGAPTPGDTADAPGSADTDNVQQGDQSGPEVPDAPGSPVN